MNRESVAYRSFRPSEFKARGGRVALLPRSIEIQPFVSSIRPSPIADPIPPHSLARPNPGVPRWGTWCKELLKHLAMQPPSGNMAQRGHGWCGCELPTVGDFFNFLPCRAIMPYFMDPTFDFLGKVILSEQGLSRAFPTPIACPDVGASPPPIRFPAVLWRSVLGRIRIPNNEGIIPVTPLLQQESPAPWWLRYVGASSIIGTLVLGCAGASATIGNLGARMYERLEHHRYLGARMCGSLEHQS
ncbi:hypothetical protein GOBAR_DD35746 [Gossypium barbadense]|nr:hypothetical protein GOBAR_DD35746 [Gossypium barbadense]